MGLDRESAMSVVEGGEVSPASVDVLHLNQDRVVVRLPRSPVVGRLVAWRMTDMERPSIVPLHVLEQQDFSLARSISHIQGNKQLVIQYRIACFPDGVVRPSGKWTSRMSCADTAR